MRLYLDAQQAQERPFTRGLPRYVTNHAAALVERNDVVCRVALDPTSHVPRRLHEALDGTKLRCVNELEEFESARIDGQIAYHLMSPFHWTLPLDRNIPVWAVDSAVPLVATLYDLIPLSDPERYLLPPFDRIYQSRLALVECADLVLAISQHVAQEAMDQLGIAESRIAVIGAGYDPYFAEPPAEHTAAAERPSWIDRPFALTVAYSDPRKNTAMLIRAWAELPEQTRHAHQLVVVGDLTNHGTGRVLDELARDVGLSPSDVVFPGPVDDTTLRWLYQHTRVLVCPSLVEGFGLPVIEACAAGAVAITSNTTSLPEILAWEPASFDPRSVDDITGVLERALSDSSFRSELALVCASAAERFTWDAVAERTADATCSLA